MSMIEKEMRKVESAEHEKEILKVIIGKWKEEHRLLYKFVNGKLKQKKRIIKLVVEGTVCENDFVERKRLIRDAAERHRKGCTESA